MKALNIFTFIFGVLFFQASIAEDFSLVEPQIELIQHEAAIQSKSSAELFILKNQLSAIEPQFEECIHRNTKLISRLHKENEFLNDPKQEKYLTKQKNEFNSRLDVLLKEKAECDYLLVKLKNVKQEIIDTNFSNIKKNFFIKQSSFWDTLIGLDNFIYPPIKTGIVFKMLSHGAAFYRTARNDFLMLLFIIFIKLFGKYQVGYFSRFADINFKKFLVIVLIFIVSSPIQFILLKTLYNHGEPTIISFFNRPNYNLVSALTIFYLYVNLKFTNYYKDFLLLLISTISYFLLLRYAFALNHFELLFLANEKILFLKYLLLIDLQIVLFFSTYWLLKRGLKISFTNKYLIICYFIPLLIFFILGLFGYIDMAFNVDLSVLIIMVLMVIIVIMIRILKKIYVFLNHPSSEFRLFFKNKLGHFDTRAFLAINILVSFISALAIIQIFTVMMYSFPVPVSAENADALYAAVYDKINLDGFSFRLVSILRGLIIFQSLNILSFFISSYLAKKFLQDLETREKTANLFYWLFFIINVFILMFYIGINFSNFIILLGGLSFGIGLGLKNILSSIISSIILFVNRPFEIGDYIEINQTKGYVKRITLLETMIETLDKNILIMPNQMVASSVIQNITYAKKSSYKIHLKYIIMHFEIEQDDEVKAQIRDILENNENIVIDEHNTLKFLLTPVIQTADDIRLEIIFSMKSLKHLHENLAAINRQLLKKLKAMNLEVKFEDIQQPLKT